MTLTPIYPLLLTVFNVSFVRFVIQSSNVSQSIAEVFLLCISGYILASHGILDRKMQKVFPASSPPPVVADMLSAIKPHECHVVHPGSPVLKGRFFPFTRCVPSSLISTYTNGSHL